MRKTVDEINKENNELAKTIVHATITDWTGKVLFESDDYDEAVDKYFTFDDDDDVQLNSYDDKGINHGIFY